MIKMTTKYKVFQDSKRMMVKKLLLIKKYKNSNLFNKLGKELVKICYKNSIKRKIIMMTSFWSIKINNKNNNKKISIFYYLNKKLMTLLTKI
jgi:hypothetical protein